MPPMDYGSFAAQWWQLPWPGANNWNLKLLITHVCQLLCICHRNICSKLPFFCTASNTCTCMHTRCHGWSHRTTQYREVTRYLALYESLVIWSYKDQMDTVRFPLRVFTSMRTSYKIKIKKRESIPNSVQSHFICIALDLIPFGWHGTWMHNTSAAWMSRHKRWRHCNWLANKTGEGGASIALQWKWFITVRLAGVAAAYTRAYIHTHTHTRMCAHAHKGWKVIKRQNGESGWS